MTDLFCFPGGNLRSVDDEYDDSLGSLLSIVVSLMAWGPDNSLTHMLKISS